VITRLCEVRRACEVRLRDERKAGAILASMQKAKGGKPKGSKKDTATAREAVKPRSSSLASAAGDISHKQSSQWQKLARVPDEQFEAALAADDRPAAPCRFFRPDRRLL
jgi:hypothetical protein